MGSLIGGILGINQNSSSTPSVTARDILKSSESTDPQAAVLGSDGNFENTMNGTSSLTIDLDSAANSKKQHYNGLYNSQK